MVIQSVDFRASGGEGAWGKYRCVAFVLPAGQVAKPRLVDLGEAEGIDGIARTFRRPITQAPDLIVLTGEEMAERRLHKVAARLHKYAFNPLIPALDGQTMLFIVPDGGLNLVPLELARDDQSHYLIETYRFTYLSSGQDVLTLSPDPL